MSRPLVHALCREGGALLSNSNGGLRGGAVLIRKVPLVGLIAAAPRCSISCSSAAFPVPAIPRLRNKNTRPATTPRFSLTNSWNTATRHCSSHASSSLVKMATDRDILSDEYVSWPAFIPLWILELESLTTFFLQCQADQLRHLSVRSPASRPLVIPRSRCNRSCCEEFHQVHYTQHPRAQASHCRDCCRCRQERFDHQGLEHQLR